MIEVKVLEIRDCGTHIGILAIQMASSDPVQSAHLRRDGYSRDGSSVVLVRLNDSKAANDPYSWPEIMGGTRTMQVAHAYVAREFDRLSNGDVVDVQYILGETKSPKTSEVHVCGCGACMKGEL